MRSRWLRRLLWLAGVSCLWLNVLNPPPLETGAYLQDVTATEATVAMITGHPTQLVCSVYDASGGMVQTVRGPATRRRHALRVNGLQPGTEYRYRVGEVGGGDMQEGRLRTAPVDDGAPVHFAFLGDSGEQPWWVWLQRTPAMHLPARWHLLPCASAVTGNGAALAEYGPDFVLHLGDAVYPRGLHAHYSSAFFRPFAEVMRNAPLYAVLGNHDVMDSDGVQMLSNLRLPASEVTGDGRCLSFCWGPVRVIGLDCNTDRVGGHLDAGHPAVTFLLQELSSRTEPWVVVATHFPMRSASRQRDRGDLLLSVLPLLREHGVTLYLSGHDHCYQRFGGSGENPDVPLVVSGGGGKNLYEIRPDSRAAKLESAYHWCSAEAAGARMVVRAHGMDGSLIDTFTIDLPHGELLASLRVRNPGRAARIDGLRR